LSSTSLIAEPHPHDPWQLHPFIAARVTPIGSGAPGAGSTRVG